MFWNEQLETMSRDEMTALQGARLRDAVTRAYGHVAPYRAKMKAAGLEPGDIRGLEDLPRLPFTLKTDLRDSYPYGMFATPLSEVVRIHASSGTTGKQTVVGYTKKDVDIWSECMARSLTMCGVTREDVMHVSYGYGLFTGGLGGHYGGETVGCATIPVSTGNTKRQLQIMADFGSTVLLCTPSYAMLLGDAVRAAGLQDKLKLRLGFFGAEPWTEGMRAEIEARLGLKAYDIYGLSEISGPGVANECPCKTGLHVQEDHFLTEVVDPATGQPLPDGQRGELVFTCVTKEAMPLIRYNTRDITSLKHEKCACGRTLVRMDKPTGRTDDMLIIRGVNVFPSQIEAVLLGFGEAAPYYLIVVDRKDNLDTLEIQVEMAETAFSDEVRAIEELERRIRREVESTLGIAAKITLVQPKSIERSEGKAKRVIDKRTLG
ncbi:MAG: phenylacetate--CoA ligase [Oscillospiraceae bacterium]|jgi:phenylacetate-CoA ligase|nr:phenylacetate--CoA ligase [Oscillospiraceae bacterium]